MEKIYIIQPITEDNAEKYRVLQEEAVSLIESAGAAYAGTIYQNVREINPATFIGEGKLRELKERLYGLDEITVLFNGELSPSQTLNISAALDNRKVIDRTTLILDIFAKNAQSSEGKLQVELAQLKYIYPRLKGKGEALSRLGGGVGTLRTRDETQLETGQALYSRTSKYLEQRLRETEKRRSLQTVRRKKDAVKTIALVGYTNTGKSTLLNLLTGSDVYVKNELFATLDPTARSFSVNDAEFLLVDTVGFLQDLPHNLIEAFKSTLESALNCDLALIVWRRDGRIRHAAENYAGHLARNGFCLALSRRHEQERRNGYLGVSVRRVAISAKENLGIDALKREILKRFSEDFLFCNLFVPYSALGEYGKVKPLLTEKNIEFTDEGQKIRAVIPSMYADKFTPYITGRNEY